MSIAITKTNVITLLTEKSDLVQTFRINEGTTFDLKNISEFHNLVKDYLSFLGNLCQVPLTKSIPLERKIKLSTPAWFWVEQFLAATDIKANKAFDGLKPFTFVKNGKDEMKVQGITNLETAMYEAKRRVKELNVHATHQLMILKSDDLNYQPIRSLQKDDPDFIYVDLIEGCLLYAGEEILALMKTKLPYKLLEKSFEYPDGIPLNELTPYKVGEINIGIQNFKSTFKSAIKSCASKRIKNSFVVKKPENKVIFDSIFIKK